MNNQTHYTELQKSNNQYEGDDSMTSLDDDPNNNNILPTYKQSNKTGAQQQWDLDHPDAPPPYTPTDPMPSAPPYYPLTSHDDDDNTNTQQNGEGLIRQDDEEDLDFFKYTIPCKKITTYCAVCIGLLVLIVLLLLMIFGKL